MQQENNNNAQSRRTPDHHNSANLASATQISANFQSEQNTHTLVLSHTYIHTHTHTHTHAMIPQVPGLQISAMSVEEMMSGKYSQ